jgi:hypothetical protein
LRDTTKRCRIGLMIVFDEDMLKEVDQLADKLTVEQMANYFNIGKTTFYAVCKRQPELMERYKRGKSKRIQQVVSKLYEKIEDGDTACTIFYLKTQAGWKEQEVQTTELPAINIILANETDDTTDQDIH